MTTKPETIFGRDIMKNMTLYGLELKIDMVVACQIYMELREECQFGLN